MELLPDEILVYMLQYALPAIGRELHQTRAALMLRETSLRFKEVIESYVLASVTKLCAPILSSTQLCLFKRLHTLELEHATALTDAVLSQMTGLKELLLRNTAHAVTECGLSALTNLRCLQLYKPHQRQRIGLTTLVQLEELVLTYNDLVDDDDIACLTSLRSLELYRDIVITGRGFTSRLERLYAGGSGCRVTWRDIHRIGKQLNTLKLVSYTGVPHVVREMTNLTELRLKDDNTIDDLVLGRLTNLQTLRLFNVPYITNQGLARLPQLTSLALVGSGSRARTPGGLSHLQATLKTLLIIGHENFTLQNFLPYTALQSLSYQTGHSIPSDTHAAKLLRARGVTLTL